ncbi:hypothetical protein C7441_11074 [Pseudaminobacter salicylatoxidans]|uniref:Uncharacterized protein n=1 Tax=Pseudaminobacter salicylatoxidans TaxID=93369 RepID=A0A316C0L9_PSESE|nr:hypothetical protein [Pseudaminobacter salicylatoxidans]PWJ81542.1 hypothetical protein C7441_11074 [Pseudaminobacter salicylatoxidans]
MIDDRAKLDMVRASIIAKRTWLDSFSRGRKKRPDHEIEKQRHDVLVLLAIEEDYVAKVERRG